ncbi:MAG: transcription termination/antitermination factor NusG [SAR324 cluster bacterium]|nr:transcription termination/antitermination factor NusG [SAR324 cluster bacterium]
MSDDKVADKNEENGEVLPEEEISLEKVEDGVLDSMASEIDEDAGETELESTEELTKENAETTVAEETGEEQSGSEPIPNSDPDYKWYILQAYAQYEKRVEKTIEEKLRIENLRHLVETIFIPSEDVVKTKGGKQRTVNQKYFPGYILIKAKLTPELWHLLMNTPRVSGFVGGTQKEPLPLDEKELQRIIQQIDSGVQQAVLEEEYVVGQKVMIAEGPFNNFNGTIDEINREKRKLKVLVSIFGRPTPVEIEFDKVKSL